MTDIQCGVLFDLDGVLLDSEGQYSIFWEQMDREHPTGIPQFASYIKGFHLSRILSYFESDEVRQQVLDKLLEYELNMRYEFFPGALDFVRSLKGAHIPMAIVTSSDRKKMQSLYSQHPEFPSLFDQIIISGNLINGGYVAGADDWVYYTIPEAGGNWHTSAIGRMHEDGSEKSTIYRSPNKDTYIWHMVVEGGRLYFVEENEKGTGAQIITTECNGSGRRVLGSCVAESSFMLNDGVIYAQVKDGLFAYEPKTDKSRTIKGGPSANDLWRTYGEGDDARVYYFEKGSSKLYSAPLTLFIRANYFPGNIFP